MHAKEKKTDETSRLTTNCKAKSITWTQTRIEDEIDSNPGTCDSTSTDDVIIPVASTSSASSDGDKIQVNMNFRKKSSRYKEITKNMLKLQSLNQKVKALSTRNETPRKRVYLGSWSEKSSLNDRKTQEQSKISPSKSKKRK